MATLAANANVTLTLTAYDSVTIESRGPVLVEAVSGLGVTAGKIAELQGVRTLGPFTASGSLKLTSYGRPLEYQVADGAQVQPIIAIVSGAAPNDADGRPDGTFYIQTA